MTYLRSTGRSDCNVLASGELGRCSQRGDDGSKRKSGGRRGAEDQWETKMGAAVSRGLSYREPSTGQYLRGEAGCPMDPVLVSGVVPAHVLAQLNGMAFEE